MKKIVISLGGSILIPELKSERIKKYAQMLSDLKKKGLKIFIVVGGGKVSRAYIQAARELGANDAECDKIGIDFTRLNSRLLIAALGENAHQEPAKTIEEATVLGDDKIIVMGGTHIGHTTDAVAALLAEYAKADLLIIATNVDGVYTADPNKDPHAKKLDHVTSSELVNIVMKNVMKAGSAGVVDPLAAKIIERSATPAIVVNGNDTTQIESACFGVHKGTVILPG